MFSVEEAGKESDLIGDEENLIQKFVEYIKVEKQFMYFFVKENNS